MICPTLKSSAKSPQPALTCSNCFQFSFALKRLFDPRALPDALRLTFEVLPLVLRARLSLWREPFPAFHARWSAEIESELRAALASPGVVNGDVPGDDAQPDAQTKRLAWECSHAVSRAARLVPRASCLTQALVLQRVLARRGQECSLFLGALRPGAKPSNASRAHSENFEAHAWIEWHGRVLIGGDISRWTPFPLNRSLAPSSPPDSTLQTSK